MLLKEQQSPGVIIIAFLIPATWIVSSTPTIATQLKYYMTIIGLCWIDVSPHSSLAFAVHNSYLKDNTDGNLI